jgi:hypothetical protein
MTVRLTVALVAFAAITVVVRAQSRPVPGGTPATEANALVTGRVVDAEGGAPVAGAVVTIPLRSQSNQQAQQAPRVLTDGQGRCFLRDLAPGSYTLSATKGGWIPGAYGRGRPGGATVALDLTDGQRWMALTRARGRSWRLARGQQSERPARQRRSHRTAYANQRPRLRAPNRRPRMRNMIGIYRFAELMPGDYFIAVPGAVTTQPANMPSRIDTHAHRRP